MPLPILKKEVGFIFNHIGFSSLSIELTRRCNLACKHCLKGDPENVDISNEVIDSLIDTVNAIYSVQFTGGEPMLAIDRIQYLLEAAKRADIVIFGLSLVTNGTILNDEIISVFKDWHNYIKKWCDEDVDPSKLILIGVSTDVYHGDEAHERFERYKEAFEGIATVTENKGGEIPHKMGRAKNLAYAFPFPEPAHKIAYRIGKNNIEPRCTENFRVPTFTDEQVIVMCQMQMDIFGQFVPFALYSNTDRYEPISSVVGKTAKDIIADIDTWNETKPNCKDVVNQLLFPSQAAAIIKEHDDPESYFFKWMVCTKDVDGVYDPYITKVHKLAGLKKPIFVTPNKWTNSRRYIAMQFRFSNYFLTKQPGIVMMH